MEDEMVERFESRLKVLDLVVKLGWGLLCGAFALGVWAAMLEWRIQRVGEEVHHHTSDISTMSLWKASTDANRYTASDAQRDERLAQEQLNNFDKRLTRTEDAAVRIEKAVDRIESKLSPKP
jgi:hypothetical protein